MRTHSVVIQLKRQPPRMVRILREHPQMPRSEAAKLAQAERQSKENRK